MSNKFAVDMLVDKRWLVWSVEGIEEVKGYWRIDIRKAQTNPVSMRSICVARGI